jgi:hypothetical protein
MMIQAESIEAEAANARGRAGVMADDSVRVALEQLIRASGEGYAAVSRLLGRNPAYIQQFIKRGVPRRLSELDRRLIAGHFGVSEDLLGAPAAAPHPAPRVPAPLLAIAPLAAVSPDDPPLSFDAAMLRPLPDTRLGALAMHRLEGDSMAPTLLDGDLLLVDTADRAAPRDGLHVIASDGARLVKRLSVHPVTRRIAILSDNSAYPSFPDCDPGAVAILGRVIWVGRRLP